jgi:plasmid stabilization system protein ParE
MGAELILAPEAERDIAEAYAWYEGRRPGLGEEFLSCLEAYLQGLRRTPEIHPFIRENYRRGLVRRFPYAVLYEYTPARSRSTASSTLHVIPKKWRERLP